MRDLLLRLSALLLIAFVAMSARCVASCAIESCGKPAQPPCHQSPPKTSDESCVHAQAAADNGAKLPAQAVLTPIGQADPIVMSAPVVRVALPQPLSRPAVTSAVLRI